MYEIEYEDEEKIRKAKGIGKDSIPPVPDLYRNLASGVSMEAVTVDETRIRSQNHNIYTIDYKKRALTGYEDKRLWLSPNYSVPYS